MNEENSHHTRNGVLLEQTCFACPEQYDAYIDGEKVGYLRLRHGFFNVTCPWVGGESVYCAQPLGDGIFEDEERDKHLDAAVEAIKQWVEKQKHLDD